VYAQIPFKPDSAELKRISTAGVARVRRMVHCTFCRKFESQRRVHAREIHRGTASSQRAEPEILSFDSSSKSSSNSSEATVGVSFLCVMYVIVWDLGFLFCMSGIMVGSETST
jgi:hypothetical protein